MARRVVFQLGPNDYADIQRQLADRAYEEFSSRIRADLGVVAVEGACVGAATMVACSEEAMIVVRGLTLTASVAATLGLIAIAGLEGAYYWKYGRLGPLSKLLVFFGECVQSGIQLTVEFIASQAVQNQGVAAALLNAMVPQ